MDGHTLSPLDSALLIRLPPKPSSSPPLLALDIDNHPVGRPLQPYKKKSDMLPHEKTVAPARGRQRHVPRADKGLDPRPVEQPDQPPVPPQGPNRPRPGGFSTGAQVIVHASNETPKGLLSRVYAQRFVAVLVKFFVFCFFGACSVVALTVIARTLGNFVCVYWFLCSARQGGGLRWERTFVRDCASVAPSLSGRVVGCSQRREISFFFACFVWVRSAGERAGGKFFSLRRRLSLSLPLSHLDSQL